MTSFGVNTFRPPAPPQRTVKLGWFNVSGLLGGMLAVYVLALVCTFVGCQEFKSFDPGSNDTASAIARNELLAQQSIDEAKPIRTNRDGEDRKDRVVKYQNQIIEQSAQQRKSADTSAKAYQGALDTIHRRDGVISEIHGRWWFKVGTFIDHAFWWLKWVLIGVFVFGVAIRIAGLFTGGWSGSFIAKVGSGLLQAIPWVGAWADKTFDHAYFIDRRPKLEPKREA